MSSDKDIRQKSLWAMKAVTAGALLVAGVSCSSDEEQPASTWEISENGANPDAAVQDVGGDTAVDIGPDVTAFDTGPDVTAFDTGPDVQPDTNPDIVAFDAGEECNDQESTGVCPDHCHMDNDIDCCRQNSDEFCWSDWEEGFGCATICEGPFVPPEMTA